ncbi:MAG: hypothetical protein ACD_81C00055G0002 [uncultured bacterium]|uniref:Uncharacterized protein n=2 Tax=Candidatus Wolfeibacteriota TaxID=1752735 RepID=A0A0G1K528_9BACT|nr:MAG: hypothetical protein ACD_81C00055G0002 [uncultured bacterium]KKR12132.1 MAG: hypothetical protein UT41_C0003G0059 [Candidatus Wolfebacteria bacterium GW2011_GWC2_39_22]KKT42954.1 MAG: hypothetical protein UW32_C0003G0057 [Candidatus Wolfebacteria bacterium GW2011_GWE2_44_13]HBI25247.1 hypothetical protein [Candidatus Wolfebacteria bacterium]
MNKCTNCEATSEGIRCEACEIDMVAVEETVGEAPVAEEAAAETPAVAEEAPVSEEAAPVAEAEAPATEEEIAA